jgi:hypothetical protein
MKKIYRIVEHTYYEKGDKKRQYYTIEEQKKFLWWKLWSNITETKCDEDCYSTELEFTTESEAINTIKKLQRGNKLQGWSKEVTTVLEFPI